VWVLCLVQFIPLLLFPPSSFSPASQEWWLPVLSALLALVGALQLMVRRSSQAWPWYILSFAHGINIISRLMLFLPRATVRAGGELRLNTLYVVLAAASMLISAFYLWYLERYEVRNAFLRRAS
jgi:zinc transporter ZupT